VVLASDVIGYVLNGELAVAPDGSVRAVIGTSNQDVVSVDRAGSAQWVAHVGPLYSALPAIAPSGETFILNDAGSLIAISNDGEPTTTPAGPFSDRYAFLALGPTGRLYVISQDSVFASCAGRSPLWTLSVPSDFRPDQPFIGPDGSLYVGDLASAALAVDRPGIAFSGANLDEHRRRSRTAQRRGRGSGGARADGRRDGIDRVEPSRRASRGHRGLRLEPGPGPQRASVCHVGRRRDSRPPDRRAPGGRGPLLELPLRPAAQPLDDERTVAGAHYEVDDLARESAVPTRTRSLSGSAASARSIVRLRWSATRSATSVRCTSPRSADSPDPACAASSAPSTIDRSLRARRSRARWPRGPRPAIAAIAVSPRPPAPSSRAQRGEVISWGFRGIRWARRSE
jgi:hypothetical protein